MQPLDHNAVGVRLVSDYAAKWPFPSTFTRSITTLEFAQHYCCCQTVEVLLRLTAAAQTPQKTQRWRTWHRLQFISKPPLFSLSSSRVTCLGTGMQREARVFTKEQKK